LFLVAGVFELGFYTLSCGKQLYNVSTKEEKTRVNVNLANVVKKVRFLMVILMNLALFTYGLVSLVTGENEFLINLAICKPGFNKDFPSLIYAYELNTMINHFKEMKYSLSEDVPLNGIEIEVEALPLCDSAYEPFPGVARRVPVQHNFI
jgi:hypothetical protein